MTTTTTTRPRSEGATPTASVSVVTRRAEPHTGTTRTPAARTPAARTGVTHSRRTARSGGAAVVAVLLLTVPVVGLLDAAPPSGSTLDVAASFLVVAGLDVLVGRGLYLSARHRAHPAAYAALLSRLGHALLLVVAAVLLASRGAAGVPAFRDDWGTALLVLAVHLAIAGVALWRARIAPRTLCAAVALCGAATLALAAAGGPAALLPLLVPALAGEAVLAAALLQHALRPSR
jgi:hypothetical protein